MTKSETVHEYLDRVVTQYAKRCADVPSSHEPDVKAATIALAVLIELRNVAWHQSLSPGDVQVAIDAVMMGAGVEECEDMVGAIYYKRKVS